MINGRIQRQMLIQHPILERENPHNLTKEYLDNIWIIMKSALIGQSLLIQQVFKSANHYEHNTYAN